MIVTIVLAVIALSLFPLALMVAYWGGMMLIVLLSRFLEGTGAFLRSLKDGVVWVATGRRSAGPRP